MGRTEAVSNEVRGNAGLVLSGRLQRTGLGSSSAGERSEFSRGGRERVLYAADDAQRSYGSAGGNDWHSAQRQLQRDRGPPAASHSRSDPPRDADRYRPAAGPRRHSRRNHGQLRGPVLPGNQKVLPRYHGRAGGTALLVPGSSRDPAPWLDGPVSVEFRNDGQAHPEHHERHGSRGTRRGDAGDFQMDVFCVG